MGCKNVVVFAAPNPVGSVIEVEVIKLNRWQQQPEVRVRDPATSIVYGWERLFDRTAAFELLGGEGDSYRSPRPPEGSIVVESFRGRVLECVVANVSRSEGHAPCTSFCVEVLPEPTGPYR